MAITYDKLRSVLEGVCLARYPGPANSAKRIENCFKRSEWFWLHKHEKWEDGFVRIIMTGEYRDKEFMQHCRNFGEGSARILDEVRSIMTEWEA